MKNKLFRIAVIALAALALVLVLATTFDLTAQAQQPTAGQPSRVVSYTLYPATALVTGTTFTSGALATTGGVEVAHWTSWNSADIFVTIDGTGTFALTSTVQGSPDGTNWANVSYDYWNGSAMTVGSYSRTQTADGSVVMRVPVTGEWVRVKMDVTGPVTPTVQVTYRNN